MTTKSPQKTAPRRNIKKAQEKWKNMPKREHSRAQPEGPERRRPGTTGRGRFYRIEVRPKQEFKTFRVQDVGERGGLERLAGKRSSGSWDTASWLISKDDAHVEKNGALVIDNPKIERSMGKQFRGPLVHVKGDIFHARPRRNVPEPEKPTDAQKKARMENIKKAQAARNKKK